MSYWQLWGPKQFHYSLTNSKLGALSIADLEQVEAFKAQMTAYRTVHDGSGSTEWVQKFIALSFDRYELEQEGEEHEQKVDHTSSSYQSSLLLYVQQTEEDPEKEGESFPE